MTTRHQISFSASPELLNALDADAIGSEETISARIRKILAEHLREVGLLGPMAPLTFQLSTKFTPPKTIGGFA